MMKRRRKFRRLPSLLSTSAAVLAACACVTAPQTIEGQLTVDKAQYSMSASSIYHGFKLVYTFINRSSTTLFIQRDCQNTVDWKMFRAGSDSIGAGYNGRFCPDMIRLPAIAVAPGATRSDTLSVLALGDPNEPLSIFTGTFELVMRITVSSDGSGVVPSAVRRSPSFVIVAN